LKRHQVKIYTTMYRCLSVIFTLFLLVATVKLQSPPDISGNWVSDQCEATPGPSQYTYFRIYNNTDTIWSVEAQLYDGDCSNPNNLAAVFHSKGPYIFTNVSSVSGYANGTLVWNAQFWFNITETITPFSASFVQIASSLCNWALQVNVTTDIRNMNCSDFSIYSPCPDGQFDIVQVVYGPTRFYTGYREFGADLCDPSQRPTILSTYAVVLNGTGLTPPPAPVMAPTSPPTAPVTPPTPTARSDAVVRTVSILLLAVIFVAGLF
jgi:hypothetical protein